MNAENLMPRDAVEVEQAIQWALADGKTLEVVGHGTKRAVGRAAQWDATLDLSALSGITLYEPEELVLSAKAGTPLAEIEALVAASKQELAFEPMDFGPLLGTGDGAATIGGVLAANLSGPRRIKVGAARDHFLGVSAISGRGETFKSGGRVVKNVTGYDLCKLIAGSWGTLAAMTDVTVKTLPRAETEETILVIGLDDATARKVMAAAMGSFGDVSAAAHLPAAVASRIAESATAQGAATAFRLEGVAPSVAQRKSVLEMLLSPFGALGHVERNTLARAVACGPRCSAVRGERPRRQARPLAHLDSADAWRGNRSHPRRTGRSRGPLRLGWRARLGGTAGCGRRRRAAGTRYRRGRWRARDLNPCAGRRARCSRGLRARGSGTRGIDAARAKKLRSPGRAQCRAHVGGRIAMQTSFSLAQLADPDVAESEKILRACVHCGFCTATCPTYVLDGNELNSPRGRIYLIKEMLEHDRPATAEVVEHIDRCLSCLACMTTCPSGVHYMHLVDHARIHIEHTYRRPLSERFLRATLAKLMPYPRRFRLALSAAPLAKPFTPLFEAIGLTRLAAMLRLSPWHRPGRSVAPQTAPAVGARKGRVALLAGCVNDILAPQINAAAIRVLTRHGFEVVLAEGAGCCGSLVHHMGREEEALAQARGNINSWTALDGLDAILITASGCGTTVKDYGFMLRTDSAYAERATRVASLAKDIAEFLAGLPLEADGDAAGLVVAYHSACSLQHGQRITRQPKELLAKLGFVVKDVPDGHLCCGSAGTYNILQPDIARRLRERKVGTIERLRPDVIAAGNIGCMMQIATGTELPAVHTVELIDWATGGPRPGNVREHRPRAAAVSPATAPS